MRDKRKSVRSIKSWLFTPASRADRFGKAAQVGAGGMIVDLEDGVAPPEKVAARGTALEYLKRVGSAPHTIALRINPLNTRIGLDDLQALLSSSAQPDYVILPKCESPALVALTASLLREAGKTAEIIVFVETAKGLEAVDEIARGGVAAVMFGAADMAADLGAEPAWEPLLWARSRIVAGAAGAAIALVDSPFFEIADTEGLRRETAAAARLGFHSKCAIHPSQVAIINDVLTPTAEEIARARKIVEVNARGVGTVDRLMVDEAVARTARVVLERAGIPVDE